MQDFRIATVIGAANSGKSLFAEQLAAKTGLDRVYVATAQAFDAEMAAKIAEHQIRRGEGWRLVEAPTELPAALSAVRPGEVVLVDCLTLWLSNVMLLGLLPGTDGSGAVDWTGIAAAEAALIAALQAAAKGPVPICLVTNEVGAGIVPDSPLGRAFQKAQGRLNQRIAALSDLVVLVVAGLPLVLKGLYPGLPDLAAAASGLPHAGGRD